mmetsp:Transcript_21800/g.53833  ORF Transcript_21800/g.53833 Transcript_21800/m.53833 type:complete len:207 (+) Transcript_21800:139-759(+)
MTLIVGKELFDVSSIDVRSSRELHVFRRLDNCQICEGPVDAKFRFIPANINSAAHKKLSAAAQVAAAKGRKIEVSEFIAKPEAEEDKAFAMTQRRNRERQRLDALRKRREERQLEKRERPGGGGRGGGAEQQLSRYLDSESDSDASSDDYDRIGSSLKRQTDKYRAREEDPEKLERTKARGEDAAAAPAAAPKRRKIARVSSEEDE